MNIGIYDPYLDTLGGGEKYMLTIASCLSRDNNVSLFWDDKNMLEKAKERFDVDLSSIHCVSNIFSSKISLLHRIRQTRKYDAIFYLSDGSIPWLFGKKNFLLLQLPINWLHPNPLITKMKLSKYQQVICNSVFVKSYIDKTYDIDSQVIYPPVTLIPDHKNKQDIILSIGRFTLSNNMKKQAELIEAFKKLHTHNKSAKNWKLVLAGAVLPSDMEFISSLKKAAKGYPIEIAYNLSWESIVKLYQTAKIYWHGAGFGEDLIAHPERAEHFGISTVEAMSAGCVPVVFNAGGQKEIILDNTNGFLWNTEEELVTKTKELIENENLLKNLSQHAMIRAKLFSEKEFCRKIRELAINF